MKMALALRVNNLNKNFLKSVWFFESTVDFFDSDIFLLKVYMTDGIVFIVYEKIKSCLGLFVIILAIEGKLENVFKRYRYRFRNSKYIGLR